MLLVSVFDTELYLKDEAKNYLILKGKGIDSKNIEFSDIKGRKVIDILRSVDERKEWNNFGMKIGDAILRNNDVLEKN